MAGPDSRMLSRRPARPVRLPGSYRRPPTCVREGRPCVGPRVRGVGLAHAFRDRTRHPQESPQTLS